MATPPPPIPEFVRENVAPIERAVTKSVAAILAEQCEDPIESVGVHLLTGQTPQQLEEAGMSDTLGELWDVLRRLKSTGSVAATEAPLMPFRAKSSASGKYTQGPQLERSVGYQKMMTTRQNVRRILEDDALPGLFDKLAGDDQLLGFPEFQTALVDRLHLDLSEDEIKRIWSRVVMTADDKGVNPEALSSREIGFGEFKSAIENCSFLRLMVGQLTDRRGLDVPVLPSYDWLKSTNENYGAVHREFFGKYATIRSERDYSYHTNYTRERQEWQDSAVDSVVARTKPQANPWVVYTCGPMGAGKGYVLSWMSKNGYFPLEDIVHIDPDHFKRLMPEWDGYCAKAAEPGARPAGDMCHRESGFIQEIGQEVAMRARQNVWVDGSLRDGPWFAKVFKDVRRRFPQYKIAIFEISAQETVVRSRIASRAAKTGRNVPEELIKASLASVSQSLDVLTPLCDFVARIGNDSDAPDPPKLRAFIQVDDSGDWGRIEERFAKPEEDSAFPRSLAPLKLAAVSTSVAKYDRRSQKVQLDLSHTGFEHIAAAVIDGGLKMSPLKEMEAVLKGRSRAVTIMRQASRVPTTATRVAFCYPASIEWDKVVNGADLAPDSTGLLALAGGFVYLDQNDEIVAINAVGDVVHDHEHDSARAEESPIVCFAAPLPLPKAATDALGKRLRPVTLAALLHSGAIAFAWISAGEDLSGALTSPPTAGAFAYVFQDAQLNRYFPVAG